MDDIENELAALAHKERAVILQKFFKTGKGDYGEGDVFIGITLPDARKIAKKYKHLRLKELGKLLKSDVHEYRAIALMILLNKFRNEPEERKNVVDFYLANTAGINNWDLVDISAPGIVGEYLLDKNRAILYKFAKSGNLWERRIAIVSTFAFIRKNQFADTLKIAEILLKDKHDLIHKATGWMLREAGKRNQAVLENFLKKNSRRMPRTMLRYSIEKFSPAKRKFYMKK